ncbi:MAG: leucyl aminopeptidase family protein [Candidatus Brennerbacteria bacterium]|nr:leucyl aminopeptidase family protein [Candidatus Brennerbacteria bacterium]
MTIKVAGKIDKNAVPVLVLREKQKPDSHPFFNRDFVGFAPREGGYEHVLILAGGRRVLVFGVPEGFNHRKSIKLMRRVVQVARRERIDKITLNLKDFGTSAEVLAAQLEMANFEFVQYKEKPKEGWFFVKEIDVFSKKDIKKDLERGKIIGEEINNTRVLANTPGGDMTPQRLAEAASRAGRRAGFKVRILEEKTIRKLKMGGVIGVSQGSNERPRFIIMEYWGEKSRLQRSRGSSTRRSGPVVLVGKGVTFDTGGLNLKSSDGIYEMHMDMSGGAAVIHTLAALARLKVKKNVIGLVPAVENMPSGGSYRPGDVLRTMSGKTIEVLNTDAEGRVIMADALEYAKRYKPRLVVDVATLTGSSIVALGPRASAIFATDQKISKKMEEAGEAVGDYIWPLPLWEEYEEDIKGTFGDVSNSTVARNRGVGTSAAFLWQFIKNQNWVHLDIAPRMTTIESDNLAKGAAGAPVALLTQFLRDF